MMYGAGLTPFLAWAKESQEGVLLMDGLGMLVEQAAESFALWRGVRPETQCVIQQLRSEMAY
jgi:shikimate dehydrogenase